MSCPKDEQFGLTERLGCGWGSSEVSTRYMIFVAGDGGMFAIVCSTTSFLTVPSACVLRILRSGDDLAIVDTVLLVQMVVIKSPAEEEAAMMNGLVCPGE